MNFVLTVEIEYKLMAKNIVPTVECVWSVELLRVEKNMGNEKVYIDGFCYWGID